MQAQQGLHSESEAGWGHMAACLKERIFYFKSNFIMINYNKSFQFNHLSVSFRTINYIHCIIQPSSSAFRTFHPPTQQLGTIRQCLLSHQPLALMFSCLNELSYFRHFLKMYHIICTPVSSLFYFT